MVWDTGYSNVVLVNRIESTAVTCLNDNLLGYSNVVYYSVIHGSLQYERTKVYKILSKLL